MTASSAYCSQCGTRRLPQAQFCGDCGAEFPDAPFSREASGNATNHAETSAERSPIIAGSSRPEPRSAASQRRVPAVLLVLVAILVLAGAVGGGLWMVLGRAGPTEAQQERNRQAATSPAVEVELRVMPTAGKIPTAADVEVLRAIIELRAAAMSAAPPVVSVRGDDILVVRLPAHQDNLAIRRVLTAVGRLDFVGLHPPAPQPGTFVDPAVSRPLLSGDQVSDAKVLQDDAGAVDLSITFGLKDEGRDVLANWWSSNPGAILAVTLDGVVLATMGVDSEFKDDLSWPLAGSRAEADDLVVILRYGSLPYPVEEVGLS